MKNLWVVLAKIYWLVVALVPFFPAYMLLKLQDRLACTFNSPCFIHGLPFQVEGSAAGVFTGLVLWPMCLWQLGGGYLWRRGLRRLGTRGKPD